MRYGKPIRLPADRYRHSEAVFHLVIRTHPEVGRLPQHTRDAIWESLVAEHAGGNVALHAAVLMPDHVHLLVSPTSLNVVSWIGRWKSLSTRAAWGAGHRGTVWQRRFYDRALRGPDEYEVALAYVLHNPGEAGLVRDGEVWPHSWGAQSSET